MLILKILAVISISCTTPFEKSGSKNIGYIKFFENGCPPITKERETNLFSNKSDFSCVPIYTSIYSALESEGNLYVRMKKMPDFTFHFYGKTHPEGKNYRFDVNSTLILKCNNSKIEGCRNLTNCDIGIITDIDIGSLSETTIFISWKLNKKKNVLLFQYKDRFTRCRDGSPYDVNQIVVEGKSEQKAYTVQRNYRYVKEALNQTIELLNTTSNKIYSLWSSHCLKECDINVQCGNNVALNIKNEAFDIVFSNNLWTTGWKIWKGLTNNCSLKIKGEVDHKQNDLLTKFWIYDIEEGDGKVEYNYIMLTDDKPEEKGEVGFIPYGLPLSLFCEPSQNATYLNKSKFITNPNHGKLYFYIEGDTPKFNLTLESNVEGNYYTIKNISNPVVSKHKRGFFGYNVSLWCEKTTLDLCPNSSSASLFISWYKYNSMRQLLIQYQRLIVKCFEEGEIFDINEVSIESSNSSIISQLPISRFYNMSESNHTLSDTIDLSQKDLQLTVALCQTCSANFSLECDGKNKKTQVNGWDAKFLKFENFWLPSWQTIIIREQKSTKCQLSWTENKSKNNIFFISLVDEGKEPDKGRTKFNDKTWLEKNKPTNCTCDTKEKSSSTFIKPFFTNYYLILAGMSQIFYFNN